MNNKHIFVEDWGLIDYQIALECQYQLKDQILALKQDNKHSEQKDAVPNYLIFCEHPPTFTLGRSGSKEHLLWSAEELEAHHASFYEVRRGGDITFHGPGQMVVYFIWDLEQFKTDLHWFLRQIEETVIQTLGHFGIQGERYEGYTGVWIDANTPNARKICAMGLHCTRWVSSHGIALNIETDLSYFDAIIPCGIEGKSVSSMVQECKQKLNPESVKHYFLEHLQHNFDSSSYEKTNSRSS